MIRILVIKELKDLIRDPRIWIPFIISAIIMPAIGFAMTIPMKSSQEALAKPINIAIIDMDVGNEAKKLIEYIKEKTERFKLNLNVINENIFTHSSFDEKFYREIIEYLNNNEIDVEIIIIFPQNFSENFMRREKLSIITINVVKDISIFGGFRGLRVENIIKNYIRERYLENTNISLDIILDPYKSFTLSYLHGKKRIYYGDPSMLMSSLGFASLFLPLILMMISVSVMQMSATSMAVENEEKTLETLLTFPIPRTHILFAKLLGSFIVSAIGSIFNIIGFIIYMGTFTAFMNTGLFNIDTFVISIQDYIYITISIMATILFTATLGIVIGALSNDVRIASTITGPMSMVVMIPGFFISYSNIGSFDIFTKIILYCIPLTQPMIMIKQALFSNLPIETPIYLVLSLIFSIILIVITANFFSLEKLSRIQRKIMRRKYRK